MIRLTSVSLREIRLPLTEAFRTAAGEIEMRRILLLEMQDGDGHTAWSECVAEARPAYQPETVDTCWLSLSEWILPLLLGGQFDVPASAHAQMASRIRGHRMARAAAEMGIWVLESLHRDTSLAHLLASSCGAAAEPRQFVETGIALGMQSSPEALATRCGSAVAEGYRRIKIKIEPGRDVAYARAAHDVTGSRTALSVDANCSYSRADIPTLGALDDLGLSMIEQPLGADDLMQHAQLQERLSTPLCLDESITSVGRVEEMISRGSARIVNLKPGRVGGFTEAIAIHDRCAAAKIPVWCGGMLESGIGRAYNVALASLPNFTLPGDLSPSARYWDRDVTMEPWTMDEEGRVTVPLNRIGIGVDVNESLIDSLTVRRADFVAG